MVMTPFGAADAPGMMFPAIVTVIVDDAGVGHDPLPVGFAILRARHIGGCRGERDQACGDKGEQFHAIFSSVP